LETGDSTATGQNLNPEGMVVRSMGDTKWGLSLGHHDEDASTWGLRANGTGFTNINQQNPIGLTYGAKAGDMGWAATLVYSNYNDKVQGTGLATDITKESSLGVKLGARAGNWDAALDLGLTSTAEQFDGAKYTGNAAIMLKGGYMMDQWYLFGDISSAGYKIENTAGAEVSKFTLMAVDLGVTTEVKKDGSGMFYGAKLHSQSTKNDTTDVKTTDLTLPLWIGLEVDAASWLTLRGSVQQTLQLLNNTKVEASGETSDEKSPAGNDTTVAAGAGLKFNKITVDGTLQAASNGTTSQQLNGNSLLTMLGLTYWY
jgi:hypothetical protein